MKNGALLGDVSRLTQGVPEGPVQVEHARCSGCLGNLLHKCQRDRRHTRRLDLSCQLSHGPRAYGSSRDEEHQVNVRVGQAARNLPSGGKQRFRTSAEAKAKVLVCDLADDALGL